MTTDVIDDRLKAVENEIMRIKKQLAENGLQTAPASWKRMFGIFADSEGFEEATRLGREYRASQRPQEDTETSQWFFWTPTT